MLRTFSRYFAGLKNPAKFPPSSPQNPPVKNIKLPTSFCKSAERRIISRFLPCVLSFCFRFFPFSWLSSIVFPFFPFLSFFSSIFLSVFFLVPFSGRHRSGNLLCQTPILSQDLQTDPGHFSRHPVWAGTFQSTFLALLLVRVPALLYMNTRIAKFERLQSPYDHNPRETNKGKNTSSKDTSSKDRRKADVKSPKYPLTRDIFRATRGLRSIPNMTGRPGCRTMEMIGGSSVSYLARTPYVRFYFLLCLIGVETEGLLDYQGRAGIISIVRWSLRPVIFGVDTLFVSENFGARLVSASEGGNRQHCLS